jgi:DNA/RNA-binding protein KIN17
MCQKQCRDEHGFKCHCTSESHMRMMKLFAENADHYITAHSNEFHAEFMALLRRKKAVEMDPNELYQEHILDPEHMHLNATRWSSLTDYIMWMGRQGDARVEQGNHGLVVTFIDKQSLQKEQKEKQQKAMVERTEEDRERSELQKQIQRANSISHRPVQLSIDQKEATELKREGSAKPVKIELKTVMKKPRKPIKLSKLMQ